MGLVYFLNGLSALAVSGICIYALILWSKKRSFCSLGRLIGMNGILYIIPAFIYIAWSFGLLSPQASDFVLIEGAFNIAKATILLAIVYKLVNNKNLFYFLFLFLLSAVAIPYTISAFFLFISAISYSLILIVSMDLIFFSNYYLKKAGYIMLAYSLLSIFLLFFVLFGRDPASVFWFIPNITMAFVFFLFFLDIKHCGVTTEIKRKKRRKIPLAVVFAKFLLFVTSMTAFVFLNTIAAHELGHALTAQYYGCERSKAVIYDISNKPYTEMVCRGYYNEEIITLAGIILTFAIGFIFFFTGGEFTSILSYLIFGFAFLISYGDLLDLGFSLNIVAISIFLSFILIVTGVIKLSFHYVMQESESFEKEMEELHHDNYFWIDEKTPIKSLYGFISFLHSLGNREYTELVEKRKKELLRWIGGVADPDVAENLGRAKHKGEAEAIIIAKLLKDSSSKKHILKFICYPLLEEKVT